MFSSMTYWMYKMGMFPNTPTYTQEDYNWKQKSTMNKFYKNKSKKKKK